MSNCIKKMSINDLTKFNHNIENNINSYPRQSWNGINNKTIQSDTICCLLRNGNIIYNLQTITNEFASQFAIVLSKFNTNNLDSLDSIMSHGFLKEQQIYITDDKIAGEILQIKNTNTARLDNSLGSLDRICPDPLIQPLEIIFNAVLSSDKLLHLKKYFTRSYLISIRFMTVSTWFYFRVRGTCFNPV